MTRKYRLMLIMLAMLVLSACSERTEDDSALRASIVTPEEEKAVALYKSQCLSCHAIDLGGRVGPSLKDVGTRLSEDEIRDIVTDGYRGMPSYRKILEESEIQSIAAWLANMNEEQEGDT
ncbi:cytochrome c [Paenibacillus glucanolyticus]|jgi:cytochrome c551|nr:MULTISPECIES: cytochrome c [Paenibacillus]ANA81836.1 cytochrome C551 [Paenibacillus glucanolyticus]AVV59432.1 cytochrome c [Paenibacillus glucanolyticus]ETT43255.1 cytochrome c551 precursor [Paenibacillus sp. FSL R5-808]